MMNFEKFGIEIPFGRTSGNVKVHCPQCSDQRHDKRDRSLSVDLKTGMFKCHYCGFSGCADVPDEEEKKRWMRQQPWFNEHPIKRERKEYKKPTHTGKATISDRALKWFEGRGISQKTLEQMRVTEGLEWMPQKNGQANTIQFNYYHNGELVNTKFRTGDKCFKLCSGAELLPYNIDAIKGTKECIITEGECFDDQAQVLTQQGWKLIKDVRYDDVVAQWENGRITFAKPLAKVCKPYNGEFLEFSNSRNSYYSFTTPKHNLLVERFGKIKKMRAEDIFSQIGIVRSGISNGAGIPLSDDMLRLFVAISADFSIREKGDIYASFKKKRKVERISSLLVSVGVRHTINPNAKNGYTNVFIHRNSIVAFKEFPFEWLYLATSHQIGILLEELVFWDGNSVKDRTMKEYSSKLYHNAMWVQTLCHIGGMSSTIQHRKNKLGEWYKVSMLRKDRSSTSIRYRKKLPYNGMVYCFTMPAGTLLVRQNELITVSGNCDTLSFVECGRTDVVSVPNGANANLNYLDDYIEEYFDDKDTIFIASDTDTKGVMLRDELIRRFGAERCRVLEYGEGCKDANEHLQKFGKASLLQCLQDAPEIKIEGIFQISDFEQSLDALFENGMQRGVTIGHENFDRLCSFETKRICVVTGIPGSGKSEFIDEIAERLNMRYGWRFAYFSPENAPLAYHASKLIEKFTGKHFSKATLTFGEYRQVKEHLENDFFFIAPHNDYHLDTILALAKALVRRKGIKALIIDPYNRLENEQGGQNETQYVSTVLDKLTNFAQQNDVLVILMAHPTKLTKNKDGVYEAPTLYDISGSANFFNKTDFGLVVHRNRLNNTVEVHVKKVKFRHLGECGTALFRYNLNNGRYQPFTEGIEPQWDNSNHIQKDLQQKQQDAAEEAVFPWDDMQNDDCPF